METQRKFVEQQLTEFGFITRNTCLKNYISRLGAIICLLKKQGWDISGENLKGDYIYHLKSLQATQTNDNSKYDGILDKQFNSPIKQLDKLFDSPITNY